MKTHRRRLMMAAAGAALIAFGTLGCSGNSTSGSTAPQSDPGKPHAGGTLTLALDTLPTSLDPVSGQSLVSSTSDPMTAIYDALMYENYTTGQVVMETAQSLTSTDAIHWTLRLRPGIRFSDGTPYDSAAVEYNWQRFANPALHSSVLSEASEIHSMKVTGPTTLEITLVAPIGQFPRLVADDLSFIGSPTAIRSEGTSFSAHPVGAGPFILKQWVQGSQMTLTRNPHYWNSPRPYLSTVVIEQIPDLQQQYNAFTAGQADVVPSSGTQGFLPSQLEGHQVVTIHPAGATNLLLDTSRAPFNNINARLAVAYGIDRQQLVQVVDQGTVPAFTTMFPRSSPFYDGSIDWPQYDAAKAQQYVNKYVQQTGKPLSITFTVTSSFSNLAQFVQADLQQLKNVKVQVQTRDLNSTVAAYVQGQYQMGAGGYAGYDPDTMLYSFWHTTPPHSSSFYPFNFSFFSDPVLDKALDEGRASLEPAVRHSAYMTAMAQVASNVPEVEITGVLDQVLYQPRVHNLTLETLAAFGIILWDRIWVS